MTLAQWSLFIGILLLTMLLIGTFLERLPISIAMIYLGIGFVLGPAALGVLSPDPSRYADTLATVSEIALLVSLFSVGLKLGVPISDRRWVAPLRLAFVSMSITVGLIAMAGVAGLGLSLGGAVLLGAILAPTDPVLASEIQTGTGHSPDLSRFSLAAEGGLNDGAAFPFVLLGLGLLGQHELGEHALRWWLADLAWPTVGGMLIGALIGAAIGNLVIYLRTRHRRATGMDEFLSLGVIAIAYGSAQLCLASGFLAVFTAGLALRRVHDHPVAGSVPLAAADARGFGRADPATHSHHATAAMTHAVLSFNEQLERLVELAVVLVVGAMLPYVTLSAGLWWFILLLFVVLRPLSVFAGLAGQSIPLRQHALIGWFGIRGIGSVFYLAFALRDGVPGVLAEQLTSFTLATVAVSILVHGASVHPLMRWYARHERTAGHG